MLTTYVTKTINTVWNIIILCRNVELLSVDVGIGWEYYLLGYYYLLQFWEHQTKLIDNSVFSIRYLGTSINNHRLLVYIILYYNMGLRDTPGFCLCQGLLGVYLCLIMYAQAQWSNKFNIWISDVYRNEVGGGNNSTSIVLNTLVIPIYQLMSHRQKSST